MESDKLWAMTGLIFVISLFALIGLGISIGEKERMAFIKLGYVERYNPVAQRNEWAKP